MTHLKRLDEEPGARGERAREVLSDERWAEPPPRVEDEIWASLRLALPIAPLPGAPATSDGGALGGAGGSASSAAGAAPAAASASIAGLGATAGSAGSSVFFGGAVTKTLVISALVAGGGAVGWQLLPRPAAAPPATTVAATAPAPAPGGAERASPLPAAHPPELPAAPVAPRGPATPARQVEPAPSDGAGTPEAEGTEPLPVGVAALPDAPAEPPPSAAGAPNTGLIEESAWLTAARAALRRGSLVEATRHLDAHERRFPDGRLVQEREALRIEALHQAGSDAAAAQRLEDYARRYPESPHAARLEQILARDGETSIGK
ncbi:MAG TPA: hypothetical protein PLU22_04230 [Polyangiaceae bacterium]|nr:hypothetical protein [Polyangiaceae bacterium]